MEENEMTRPYARHKKRAKTTRRILDTDKINSLVLKYRPLAVHWAEHYQKKTPQLEMLEDLTQEATLAMYKLLAGSETKEKKAEEIIDKYLRSAIRKLAVGFAEEQEKCRSLDLLIDEDETDENSEDAKPFDIADEIHDDGFADEETEMFDRLSRLLDKKEMKLAELLYAGHSAREAAKRLRLSHTAVNKRIKKLREKLAPWAGIKL